jgi:vacuolar-type H+-ATPase subunit I/STV1|tara:strand:- start:191 stop:598 length:408 start_codon:yes stop_codon:yes gene_type:complete
LYFENLRSIEKEIGGMTLTKKTEAERLVEEFSEDLAYILQTFIDETQDAKVVISRIETEIIRLKEDINGLNKLIRDGNGQPPMITRIAVLEEKIAEIKEKIESVESEGKEERRMRWEFLLAAIPGLLALLTGGMI